MTTPQNLSKLTRAASLVSLTVFLSACATANTMTTDAAMVDAPAVVVSEAPTPTPDAMAETNTTTDVATASATADEEIICKRQAVVGSNFKRKVCAVASSWTAASEDSRRATRDLQRAYGNGD